MFHIGQFVVYNSTDVCRVEAIGALDFVRDSDARYYTLRPFQSSCKAKIYIPVDTAVFMRKIMTREEARLYLTELERMETKPSGIKKRSLLMEHYQGMLSTHNTSEHLRLFKQLYQKDAEAANSGKMLNSADVIFYQQVTKLLSEEISLALHEPPEVSVKRLRAAASGNGCPDKRAKQVDDKT